MSRDNSLADAVVSALSRVEAKLDLVMARLDVSNSGSNTTQPEAEFKFFGTEAELDAANARGLGHRWHKWEHVWRCNLFNDCNTWYWNESFIIDEATGSMKQWNAIETAVQLSTDSVPIPWDHKGEWYRYQAGGTHAGCGWIGKKDGRDVEIWGVARFYPGTGGYYGWRWFSRA